MASPKAPEQEALLPQDRSPKKSIPLLELSKTSPKATMHAKYDTEMTQASPGGMKEEISVTDPVQLIVPQSLNLARSDDSEEAALQRAAVAANWGSHPFESAGSSTPE
jgi:hypothetical protein